MRKNLRSMLASVAAASLMLNGASALASEVFYDFNQDITTITGLGIVGDNDQLWQAEGGNTGGFLAMTYPENYQESFLFFPNIDPAGTLVVGFKLECDLRIGNGAGDRPADGFSISFAREGDPALVTADGRGFAGDTESGFTGGENAPMPETGTSTGIAICFDTWSGNALPDGRDFADNGTVDDPGGIIVRVDNKTVLRKGTTVNYGACTDINSLQTGPRDAAFWALPPTTGAGGDTRTPAAWDTLCWQPFSVDLAADGKLTVKWKGATILDQFQTTFFPSRGRLVLGGRTGGANEQTHLDNLRLTTITQAGETPSLPPTVPANVRATAVGARRVVLAWDASTERPDPAGAVAYKVEKDGQLLATLLTATTYTDNAVNPTTQHTYKVLATDVFGNESALSSAVNVTTVAEVAGPAYLLGEIYDGISGTAVDALYTDPKFPASPDRGVYLNGLSFGETSAFGNTFGDNFGIRIAGTLIPPVAGDYDFFVRSDDASEFFLNTADANIPVPGVDTAIAAETGCCNGFFEPGAGQTTATPIALQAGKEYGFLFIVKEGGGGDWGQVAWRLVGDPTPAGSLTPIGGAFVKGRADPTGASVSITQQPSNATVAENSTVTLTAAATGVSPYGAPVVYHWHKNGVPISGANGSSYTTPLLKKADNGAKYKVLVAVPGASAFSMEATLTVTDDVTRPTITTVKALTDTAVTVGFSEPVTSATAGVAGNYSIPGLTVQAATVLNATTVQLTTTKQGSGATYTLTVSNVRDTASTGGGNVIAAPGNSATFKSLVFAAGVLHKFWDNITQNNIAGLTGNARFPDSPTFITIEPMWEYGPNGSNESGSNYGNQLSGWFTPAQSGNYIFFTCSDDPSNLYLSTDDNPANKKLIAQETGWSNARNWVSVGSGDLTAKRSDQFTGSEWDPPNVITLVAGKKYYMESLHTEGGGGDSVGATFIIEQEADPANGDAPRLAGSLIGTYLDPTGASVTISQAPQNTTQQELRTVTFTVTATGTSAYGSTVTYQWQKAPPGSSTFANIPGAMRDSYQTPILTLADNGAKYRVICSVPTITESSAAATLTVVPDTFAPTVTGAGAILKGTAVEIGVGFDENVDATTASAPGNYTLSKGTVTGVRYQKYDHTDGAGFFVLGTAGPFNGSAVVLTTSGIAAGDTVTVTAKNVKDVKGNAMSASGESKTFIVTRKIKWAAMGGDDFLQGETGGGQNITADPALWPDDVVAYSEADFDLISSGSANWSNYDEATFVYEEVTGDFDKVVRVEYHDPTSQWARAGMAATPKTDEGISRADVTGGYLMAQRYMLRANPAVQWNGTGGNNQNEADWRDIDGGPYNGTGTGTPAYPNAWLRMQRSGQIFNGFYSSDGVNWTAYGSHTYTTSDTTAEMPATLLVGIYYSPEFGNNTSGEGVGHSSVGKFRQYGSFVSNPSKVDFGIGLNFGADESDGSNSGTLPSISTAGVPDVVQGNWNNLSLASGTKDNLVADIKGVAQPTTATVTWNCPNTWSSTGRGEENNLLPANDKILMTGYLDTANATTTTVTISGLPSQLTAGGYDVYVYALGGVGGRGGGYRILNAANQSVLKDYVNAQSPTNPTSYVQAIPQAGAWAVGNYILFTGLNAPAIIIEGTTEGGHAFGGTPRGPINAVQLVKAGAVVAPPSLKAEINAAGKVVLTFDGTLEAADEVGGTYSAVAGSSPLTVDPTAARKFYRAKR